MKVNDRRRRSPHEPRRDKARERSTELRHYYEKDRSHSPYRHKEAQNDRRSSRRKSSSSPTRGHHRHDQHSSHTHSQNLPRVKDTYHRRKSPQSRSRSPSRNRPSSRSRSRSPPRKRHHRSYSGGPSPPSRMNPSQSPPTRSRKALPSQDTLYHGVDPADSAVAPISDKQKPNYKPTGLLAAETNKVVIGSGPDASSITLKYHEPPESRKPPAKDGWVMYVFKGTAKDPLDTVALHERSCWLLGRERAVADVMIEHPSCSKQHAVLQFRHVTKKNEWGEKRDKVGLYILDLESANGTFLNGEKLEPARYVECRSGDVLKFGESTREYVILLPPKD